MIILINDYIIRIKVKINNLRFHFRKLEKQEQTKNMLCRRKEIIKIGAQINEIFKK